ncbi:unnamed protein product [Sphenostylis stenocarpa]|uniref:Disease resistance protein At4g27190-like leucine-rich repeats domain-containing protein n=1 Tax=Sphenostylis stenocarpa TaxID=92480 RepID=A0AA86SGU2_9FABA|nr:unnamed protein product [Sphenostylis stenocarpa]
MLELAMVNLPKIWDDELPLQNQKILTVRCYHRLVSLFSSSEARALVKLQHLEISACDELVEIFVEQEKVTFPNLEKLFIRGMNGDALNEIVASKESKPEIGNKGDALGDLVFMKLEELNLEDLPKLTSFCKTCYNFKFPALETVQVRHGYELREELDCWDGDLNTTLGSVGKESNESGTRVFVYVFSLLLILEGKKDIAKTKTVPKAKVKEGIKLCNQCTKQSA